MGPRSMSTEHKRPLYAFAVLALACAFFVGSGLRSEAFQVLLRAPQLSHQIAAGVIHVGGLPLEAVRRDAPTAQAPASEAPRAAMLPLSSPRTSNVPASAPAAKPEGSKPSAKRQSATKPGAQTAPGKNGKDKKATKKRVHPPVAGHAGRGKARGHDHAQQRGWAKHDRQHPHAHPKSKSRGKSSGWGRGDSGHAQRGKSDLRGHSKHRGHFKHRGHSKNPSHSKRGSKAHRGGKDKHSTGGKGRGRSKR